MQIDTIVAAGSIGGAPKRRSQVTCRPPKAWPNEQGWNFAKLFGQTEPDLIVKFDDRGRRRPAPTTRGGSPIVETGHHRAALGARDGDSSEHRQGPEDHASRDRAAAAERKPIRWRRIPTMPTAIQQAGTFMEWAVGKQGEIMRPNSGKLMLPGSKIVWDIHYPNGGEDITDNVELGIYFYPKGQEPKFRQVLHLMGATKQCRQSTSAAEHGEGRPQGFFVMKENGRVESFQPHMHLRGKAMIDGSDPADRSDADAEPRRRLQLQLAQQLRLRRRRGAAAAEGHDPQASPRGTTTPSRTSRIPIRTCGSATAIARSDEMAHAWVNVTYMSDDDYKAEARNAQGSPGAEEYAAATAASITGRTLGVRRKQARPEAPLYGAAPFFAVIGRIGPMKSHRFAVASLAAVIAIGGWVVVGAGRPAASRHCPARPPEPSRTPRRPGASTSCRCSSPCSECRARPSTRRSKAGAWQGRRERHPHRLLQPQQGSGARTIPIGPNNRIEPGGPDLGQPTHFETGRNYGVFSIVVPKDFGTKRLTWTLIANGQPTAVPVSRSIHSTGSITSSTQRAATSLRG